MKVCKIKIYKDAVKMLSFMGQHLFELDRIHEKSTMLRNSRPRAEKILFFAFAYLISL